MMLMYDRKLAYRKLAYRKVHVHSTGKCEDDEPVVGWLLYFSTYADEGGSEPVAFVEDKDGKVLCVDPTQLVFDKPIGKVIEDALAMHERIKADAFPGLAHLLDSDT